MHMCGLLLQMSVSVLVTTVISAKTAEPIEMMFGMWTCRNLRNHVIRWGPRSCRRRGSLGEGEVVDASWYYHYYGHLFYGHWYQHKQLTYR